MAVIPVPADQTLSFFEIEGYCRKDWPRPSEPDEIFCELIRAWWRGKLSGKSGPTRLTILRHLYSEHQDRIAFEVLGEASPPAKMAIDNDGFVEIPAPTVTVPNRQPKTWCDQNCQCAYEDLARNWPDLHKEFANLIGLTEISRGDFFALLAELGDWQPSFWAKPPSERTLRKSKARTRHRTPEPVMEAIRSVLARGLSPPDKVTRKEFQRLVQAELPPDNGLKWLSEANLKRQVRAILGTIERPS